jgi:hypothetical protein
MSLVVKTTPTQVEYIKTIAGQEEGATLHFSLDIEDLEARPGRLALVRKMLASNRGPGRRRALARLVVAALVEVAGEKGRSAVEKMGRKKPGESGVQMPTPCT